MRTAALLLIFAVSTSALAAADIALDARRGRTVIDFGADDRASRDWHTEAGDPVGLETIDFLHGKSLSVPVAFPTPTRIWLDPVRLARFRGVTEEPARVLDTLEYQVYVPETLGRRSLRIQARLLLKTKEGLWFEALGRRRDWGADDPDARTPAAALAPGWNTLLVDLSDSSVDLRPHGHDLRWSRFVLSQVETLGFSFQGNGDWQGVLGLDNLVTWSARDRRFAEPLRIVDFLPVAASVPRYGRAELTFSVNRPLLNPFSSKEIAIDAEFLPPGGGEPIRIPAFYYQEYRAEPLPDSHGPGERYVPTGAGVFKVRFTPRQPGAWRWRLHAAYCSPVSGSSDSVSTPEQPLEVTERPDRGFVRLSPRDPRCFEFENGEPFFPHGHSFRSPWDPRHIETVLRRDFVDLRPIDVLDWSKLCQGLAAQASAPDGPLRRLWSQLPPPLQELLTRGAAPSGPAETDRSAILAGLNEALRCPGPMSSQELEPLRWIEEVRMILSPEYAAEAKVPRDKQKPRIRRILLEALLPGALTRTWTEDRGLRAYAELLPRMHAEGVNCFEVWMCSWWLADEWTRRWKGYHGLGAYHLENAWKLDRLLDLAAANDQYVHLVIDNHGKAAHVTKAADPEWPLSPYNQANEADGGFLRRPLEIFSDPRAREHYKDRYRHLAGRWGWSTRIYGWELWSELDLVGTGVRNRKEYASPTVREWHREMAGWLRSLDQGKRPITTHYSGDYTVIDEDMVRQPCIDYMVCDAYHDIDPKKQGLLEMLSSTQDKALNLPAKPFVVTEFGGDWNASSLEGLRGDLYAGLWWGWISRSAGTPLYWWFELVAQEDYYTAYRALARYIAGEDKRRAREDPQLHGRWAVSFDSPSGPLPGLKSLVLGDGRIFYLWAYDAAQIRHLPRDSAGYQQYHDARLLLATGQAGKEFSVEAWDSWTGDRLSTSDIAADGNGALAVPLPDFKVHVALKIRAK